MRMLPSQTTTHLPPKETDQTLHGNHQRRPAGDCFLLPVLASSHDRQSPRTKCAQWINRPHIVANPDKRVYIPIRRFIIPTRWAGVAELADALDSKSGSLTGVWVRPPPPAPTSNARLPPQIRDSILLPFRSAIKHLGITSLRELPPQPCNRSYESLFALNDSG
jgi:hypothetical protein